MQEITQLIATLKQQLKLQGKTYRDVAVMLGVSEASVKRLLTTGRMPLERLIQLSNMLGFSLAELTQEAVAGNEARLRTLNIAQEQELVSDTKLLLVAVCAFNHWTFKDMLMTYQLNETECLQRLLRLDRLRFISLLPGNRIRLTVSRDFGWIPDGPINQYFRDRGMADFLNSRFTQTEEALSFSSGMLTEPAIAKMQAELRQLRLKFAGLHEESLASPLAKRRGCGLLLAMREWEPAEFSSLRR